MKTRQELGQWGLVTPSCSLFSKKVMGVLSVWICMHMPAACVLVMLINHFDVYPHFCVLVWSDLWQCLTEVRASADRLLGFWSTDFICIAQMHCIAWKFKRTVFSAFTQLCRVTTMRRYLIGIYTSSHSEHKCTSLHWNPCLCAWLLAPKRFSIKTSFTDDFLLLLLTYCFSSPGKTRCQTLHFNSRQIRVCEQLKQQNKAVWEHTLQNLSLALDHYDSLFLIKHVQDCQYGLFQINSKREQNSLKWI